MNLSTSNPNRRLRVQMSSRPGITIFHRMCLDFSWQPADDVRLFVLLLPPGIVRQIASKTLLMLCRYRLFRITLTFSLLSRLTQSVTSLHLLTIQCCSFVRICAT